MKKRLLVILAMVWMSLPAVEIMKLSDVKAGMEGEGKTIFKGTKIETFRFKVLGILEKFAPGKNLIIAELMAPELNEGGIIAGMSGSPLYIDGKIIGAVSYGFSFSKKPIAGVTPIEDMLRVSDLNNSSVTIDISNIKVDFTKENVRRVKDFVQSELIRKMDFSPAQFLTPIKLISQARGLKPEAISLLTPAFSPYQNLQISDSLARKPVGGEKFSVSAGDAVAIPLIRGDFEYSASGTVTHVDGNKIYIFGHPFFNLGRVDFPLHRAEVISVIPSYESSSKLAATRNMIGAVQQDRFSAVQGELGKAPYMIPMRIFLKNRSKSINLEMVNHNLLTPSLAYVSLMNIFLSEYQEYGLSSLAVEGKVFIENEENVVVSDLFAGPAAFEDFSNLVLAVNFFLMNNKEKNIKIQKIDFEVNGMESIKKADLENVLVEKNAFLAGEPVNVGLFFKNEKGDRFEEKITLKAPNLKPGSLFYLMAADAATMVDFDSKMIKTAFFPNKLSALIRAINNLRKNNRVYLKLYVQSQGVFIRGYEYPYIPFSLNNVLAFNSQSGDQASMSVSTIGEYQFEVPAVVSGKKIFQFKIKERKDES